MRSEVFIFILMCAIIMCYEIFYRTNDNQMHTGTSVKLFCEILNWMGRCDCSYSL